MTDERRTTPRTELLLKVTYQEPRDLLADYLTDLGKGGMFLRTSESFEVGDTVSFAVSFPNLVEPIPLHGVVRWRRRPDADSPEIRPGVGVEFVFRDDEHREEIQALLGKGTGELPCLERPFRVLLVEDNQFAQELFRHAVKRFHAQLDHTEALEVTTASSGQEALQLLDRGGGFDLAIVDYFLPVMNGGDVVRAMRANPQFARTPILIISVGGDGVREDAVAAGADLYIDKPILLKQLLNTLRILLASRTGGDA